MQIIRWRCTVLPAYQSCITSHALTRRPFENDRHFWSCLFSIYFPFTHLYSHGDILLKRKPFRGHFFKRSTFFSSQIQEATSLRQKHMKTLGISVKQRIKLEISVNFLKNKFSQLFLHFKTTRFFLFHLQFWRSAIVLSRTLYLFVQVSLCNQLTIVLRYWKRYRAKTFKPCSTPL